MSFTDMLSQIDKSLESAEIVSNGTPEDILQCVKEAMESLVLLRADNHVMGKTLIMKDETISDLKSENARLKGKLLSATTEADKLSDRLHEEIALAKNLAYRITKLEAPELPLGAAA